MDNKKFKLSGYATVWCDKDGAPETLVLSGYRDAEDGGREYVNLYKDSGFSVKQAHDGTYVVTLKLVSVDSRTSTRTVKDPDTRELTKK